MQKRANLRAIFEGFNQSYFDGRLKGWRIRRVVFRDCPKRQGHCDHKRRMIRLNSTLSGMNLQGVLLHEMAHAATGQGHTARFFAELEKLERIGAPVPEKELDPCAQDARPAGKMISEIIEDLIAQWGPPHVPWNVARRVIIAELGFTQAEFRRFRAQAHRTWLRERAAEDMRRRMREDYLKEQRPDSLSGKPYSVNLGMGV